PLKLEWGLILGRWISIAFFGAALTVLQLADEQKAAAFAVLAVASIYNFGLLQLIRRRVALSGLVPTLGDGLLCAAMLAIVGGFASPFYVILYAIVISAGMRLGFVRGIVVPLTIVCIDGAGKALHAEPLDAGFVVRSGVLFLTVVLTSYLYEEAQKAEAALAERLHQSEVLNTALEHQALHDLLTDLPNRTLLHDRLQQAIMFHRPAGESSVALLVID